MSIPNFLWLLEPGNFSLCRETGFLMELYTSYFLILTVILYSFVWFWKWHRCLSGKTFYSFTTNKYLELILEGAFIILPLYTVGWMIIDSVCHQAAMEYLRRHVSFEVDIIAHQWYWEYIYHFKDMGSFPIRGREQTESMYRNTINIYSLSKQINYTPWVDSLYEGYDKFILPKSTVVLLNFYSDDVIHSISIPQLIIKGDASPGRQNEAFLYGTKEGSYMGGCSELCGEKHSAMPIQIFICDEDFWSIWQQMHINKYIKEEDIKAVTQEQLLRMREKLREIDNQENQRDDVDDWTVEGLGTDNAKVIRKKENDSGDNK
jgi:heme/copper-type cytochrome/quinol oxidase subunit 2